jgi:hypothetical protein
MLNLLRRFFLSLFFFSILDLLFPRVVAFDGEIDIFSIDEPVEGGLHLEIDFELIDYSHFIVVPQFEKSGLELYLGLKVIRIILVQPHRMRDESSLWLLAAEDDVIGIDIADSSDHDLRNANVVARSAIHYYMISGSDVISQ